MSDFINRALIVLTSLSMLALGATIVWLYVSLITA